MYYESGRGTFSYLAIASLGSMHMHVRHDMIRMNRSLTVLLYGQKDYR